VKGKQPSRLEDWLDEILADYVTAEPSPELERRVLDYTRNHTASAGTVWGSPLISWLSTASVMLAAATILWLGHPSRQAIPTIHTPEPRRVHSAPLKSAGPSAAQPVPVIMHRQRRHRVNRALPKRDLFPTPSPLSSEERALLAYAERPPKEIPPELTNTDRPIVPIQIAAIQIKPLDQIAP
jgi:hypothetical protein